MFFLFFFQFNSSWYSKKQFNMFLSYIQFTLFFIYDQDWYYNYYNNRSSQWIKNVFVRLCNLTINTIINFLLPYMSTRTYVLADTIDLDPLTLISIISLDLSCKTDLRRKKIWHIRSYLLRICSLVNSSTTSSLLTCLYIFSDHSNWVNKTAKKPKIKVLNYSFLVFISYQKKAKK